MTKHDERAAGADDRYIGNRLRLARLEIGMSQERLAELLGVTFQQVQKYERGVNRMAASRMFAAGRHVGKRPEYFEPKANAPKGAVAGVSAGAADAPAIDEALASAHGAKLVREFAAIPTEEGRAGAAQAVAAIRRGLTEALPPARSPARRRGGRGPR